MNKLPKQIYHWSDKAKLQQLTNSKYKRNKIPYWCGRGRCWRINDNNEFQVSVPYADFDRWANSVEKTFEMPKTEVEFISIVKGVKS